MANTEKREPKELLHFVLAFRRRKLNAEGPVKCHREPIVGSEVESIERLMARVRRTPGVWRIHRTINARDVRKAARILQHRLLDNPDDALSLVTVWKTCCLQAAAKGERNFLIDVDDMSSLPKVEAAILSQAGHVLERVRTPNGFHIVTQCFDAREVEALPGVSIQRDGYVFLTEVDVP